MVPPFSIEIHNGKFIADNVMNFNKGGKS